MRRRHSVPLSSTISPVPCARSAPSATGSESTQQATERATEASDSGTHEVVERCRLRFVRPLWDPIVGGYVPMHPHNDGIMEQRQSHVFGAGGTGHNRDRHGNPEFRS